MATTRIESYRIITVGASGTGKSAILTRYVDNTFDARSPYTSSPDVKFKPVNEDGKDIRLVLWDTAGQERFRSIVHSYYRDADGVILVYDVTKRLTFDRLYVYLEDCFTHCSKPNFVKILVGNKIDCGQRYVSTSEGQSYADRHNMVYVETSAAENRGIESLFSKLIKKILQTPSLSKDHQICNVAGQRQEDSNIVACNDTNVPPLHRRRGQIPGHEQPNQVVSQTVRLTTRNKIATWCWCNQ